MDCAWSPNVLSRESRRLRIRSDKNFPLELRTHFDTSLLIYARGKLIIGMSNTIRTALIYK
jgi:hypothetical protein